MKHLYAIAHNEMQSVFDDGVTKREVELILVLEEPEFIRTNAMDLQKNLKQETVRFFASDEKLTMLITRLTAIRDKTLTQ
jgi:transcriptional antiterminator Rof (Rho-off)